MWKELMGLLGANPTVTLIFTIIATSTIWLYKEFKEMINQDHKTKIKIINESIKNYGKLQASIAEVINDEDNKQLKHNLFEKFGDYNSLFSEDIRQIILDYYRHENALYLTTLQSFIVVEQRKLVQAKKRLSVDDNSTDILDSITRLMRPFQVIVMIWLMILFGLFFISIYYAQDNIYMKFNALVLSFSAFFSLIMLYALISLRMDNKLARQGKYRWGLISGIIITPILVLIRLDLSIVCIIIQITSLVLYVRSRNMGKEIILLD
ncbi:hypothetical protein ACP8HI_01785 [Paenibacillus sp. FA6]|uniref:hypothetical protein n=1 Tax=Paenibacillus sp. FA6 TaxID=3413029 RepID=UPI003F659E65